jgi:DNA-binding CsgD family transcriptional regulator
MRRVLHGAASGDGVVHLQLRREHGVVLREPGGGLELHRDMRAALALRADDAELLNLVAHGLSDQEIGAVFQRSRFTIRRDVLRLREAVGARNRAHLAAWAVRHGFYRPGSTGEPRG